LHLEHGLDAESRRAALLRHCEEVLAETAYDAQGYVTNRSTSSCPDATKLSTDSLHRLRAHAPAASAPPPTADLQRSTSTAGASAGAQGALATTPSTSLAGPVTSAPSIGAGPRNSQNRPFLHVAKLGGPGGSGAGGGSDLTGGRAQPPSSQHSTAAPSPTATAAALNGAPGFADRMMGSADQHEQQSPPATVGASTALGSDASLGMVPMMMGAPKPSQPPPRARPSTSAMRRPPPAAESHSLVVSSNNDLSQVSRVSAVTGEVAEVTPGAAVVDGGDVFY
jgi:hypothetical protein